MKCKSSFKKVGGVCTPTKKAVGTTIKQLPHILMLVLGLSILSVGGWAVYEAIFKISGLGGINPWIEGIIGLAIIFLVTLFGWSKIK